MSAGSSGSRAGAQQPCLRPGSGGRWAAGRAASSCGGRALGAAGRARRCAPPPPLRSFTCGTCTAAGKLTHESMGKHEPEGGGAPPAPLLRRLQRALRRTRRSRAAAPVGACHHRLPCQPLDAGAGAPEPGRQEAQPQPPRAEAPGRCCCLPACLAADILCIHSVVIGEKERGKGLAQRWARASSQAPGGGRRRRPTAPQRCARPSAAARAAALAQRRPRRPLRCCAAGARRSRRCLLPLRPRAHPLPLFPVLRAAQAAAHVPAVRGGQLPGGTGGAAHLQGEPGGWRSTGLPAPFSQIGDAPMHITTLQRQAPAVQSRARLMCLGALPLPAGRPRATLT